MTDEEAIEIARQIRHETMKDMYVFTMAMSQTARNGSTDLTALQKGAPKRAANAARRIIESVEGVMG